MFEFEIEELPVNSPEFGAVLVHVMVGTASALLTLGCILWAIEKKYRPKQRKETDL